MGHSILSRKEVFTGRAFNVEDLEVKLPDERIRHYDLVSHQNSVTIIPMDDKGNIYFVKQFRMGSESTLIELPAGVLNKDEKPETCATREVREEIGMAAGYLVHLGSVYLAPGYSSELNHIFLALDLSENPLAQDDDEFLSTVTFSLEEIDRLILAGEIQDSKSLAALYFYLLEYKNK